MPSPIEDHRESVRAFLEARRGAAPAVSAETPVEPAPKKETEFDAAQAAADIMTGVASAIGFLGR